MAEKMPDGQQLTPEQKAQQEKIKQVQEQIQAKSAELQSIMQNEFGPLQKKAQELQARAEGGDEAAQAELQQIQEKMAQVMRKALAKLEEIRALFASIGQEEKFHQSQLGQMYEQFNAQLEG